ncbi:MAG: transketolase [Candidatus Gastranaerophilales bacterium]|nr:transketolase [Candidatus Gastranaerophilales bacterium]
MLNNNEIENLKSICKQTRINILKMVHNASSGHIGGAFSGVEILNVLYNKSLNISPEWKNSDNFENRDRFILSKGHASALLYSVLAQRGFFPTEELMTFRKFSSRLQGHPCCKALEGIEVSTGSLGQGLAIGCGMASGLKMDNNPAHVVVYMGDGELQEGSVWEAFMQASHRKLDNLIAIIDRNRLQIDGSTEDVMSLDPLDKKLEAFGWEVAEIDGHNINQIYETIETAKKSNKPFAIIANTTKGKGVSFMENNAGWHGKAPNDEQFEQALKELQAV